MIVSVPELFELHEDVLVDGLVEEGVPDRRDHVGDDGVVQVRRGGHLSLRNENPLKLNVALSHRLLSLL